MTTSVYGTPIFIGREKEIAQFESMLLEGPASEKWLLYLVGEGGVGKTQLLHRFIETTEKHRTQGLSVIAAEGLIDLYWTSNQSELGLLRSIADQLGNAHFGEFYLALERYEGLFSRAVSPAVEMFEERLTQTRNAFFDSYSQLSSERIVLFFDTVETSTEAAKLFWQETLLHLRLKHPGTIAIIAGRPPAIELPKNQVVYLAVDGFSILEVEAYLAKHDYHFDRKTIERLSGLSRGRPILIALTVDWLRLGDRIESIVDYTQYDFEKKIVSRVQDLRYNENNVLLAMAHFYRRFDAQMYAFVRDIPIKTAEKLIERVSKYSFVKYRQPTSKMPESCTLHDEMRELVNEHVWDDLEPSSEYRRKWSRKIVDYYSELIAAQTGVLEQQVLGQERLAYWLDAELDLAFQYSEELFRVARAHRDTNFMEALDHEVERVKDRLPAAYATILEFRKALVLHGRGQYSEATKRLYDLLDDRNRDLVQASVRVQLTESLIYGGNLAKSIELGEQWLFWLSETYRTLDAPENLGQKLQYELGKLCNNLGLAYRMQNKLEKTIEYYERALDHFGQVRDAFSEIANTKNNLGYVFHRQGRDDEALSQCKAALTIRRHLGSPEQLGYSYNVLAMIYVDQLRQIEARACFDRAKEEFIKAGSQRGRGLVSVAYGRALRQLGRHKERNMHEPFTSQLSEYVQASQMLIEAVNIFRQIHDAPNLCEALNELGTLRRQQQDWQAAIACLHESMQLAESTGNTYAHLDNMVDLAITYDYAGQSDEALQLAEQASRIALSPESSLDAYNLYAKAQEVRTCYALWDMNVTKRCAIRIAKATKCKPTRVSSSRS